jgi:DNA topoisomerase-2
VQVFINCLIENPAFDSQTKENMTSKPANFGSSCTLSNKFYKARASLSRFFPPYCEP